MRLKRPLPNSIIVDGVEVKYQAPFDVVLELLDVLKSDDYDAEEKIELAFSFLVGEKRLTIAQKAETVNEIFGVLFERPKKTDTKKSFDFEQDGELIYAGFKQAYNIDLFEQRGKLPWLLFVALLRGLPDSTRFAQTVALRLKPIPEPNKHNAKERAALLKAKADVALVQTESERESNLVEGFSALAATLRAKAR